MMDERAMSSFNSRAEVIRAKVCVKETGTSATNGDDVTQRSTDSNYHPHMAATLTEKDFVGDIVMREVHDDGRISALHLYDDKNNYKLVDSEACAQLTKLLDSMWRSANISRVCGRQFLEDSFIRWCSRGKSNGFAEYTMQEINDSIMEYNILVPLHRVVSAAPINFEAACCTLRPILNDEVQSLVDACNREIDIETLRKNFQGSSVVECTVQAVSSYAEVVALEKANLVSDILAFYSPYTALPGKRFNGLHSGSEYVPSYKILVGLEGVESRAINRGVLSTSNPVYNLDKKSIESMIELQAASLLKLLSKSGLSDLEEKLYKAVRVFIKSAYTTSNTEKLLFGVVCLETIMLSNESEPIVQNVSHRIAFFLGYDLRSRKKLIKLIKSAYSLRSSFVHHGQTTEDKEVLMEFQSLVFVALVQMLGITDEFKSKEEFLANIDETRLSGS